MTGFEKLILNENITLYHGDCLDILPELQGIDAVISDPPYGMAWDTDSTRFSGGQSPFIQRGKNGKGGNRNDWGWVEGDFTEFDPSPWIGFDRVVLWGYNHMSGRLPVGTTLVWIKKYDHLFGTFLSDAELAWMKGNHGVYCKRDVTLLAESKERLHPTQKPVPIMIWCMEKAKVPAGGVVLDPYMGSGTTGIACIKTGRKFIGIEKVKRHFDTAAKRIEQELRQVCMFAV